MQKGKTKNRKTPGPPPWFVSAYLENVRGVPKWWHWTHYLATAVKIWLWREAEKEHGLEQGCSVGDGDW